jgi:hypothetical protein
MAKAFKVDEKLTLTDLPRALRDMGLDVSYRRIWVAVTEGRVPAEKHGKRWMIKRADLPAVADLFKPSTK